MGQRNAAVGVLMVLLLWACGGPDAVDHTTAGASDTAALDPARALLGTTSQQATIDKDPVTEAAFELVPATVHLARGGDLHLKVPRGYELKVACEGLARPRFLTLSPDGRMFVTDMHDQTDNKKGRVCILSGWNEEQGRFTRTRVFLDSLRNPNQVAFYVHDGDTLLYVTTTDRLLRYDYHAGDTVCSGSPTVVTSFPAEGLGYKYGGWHLTRSLAIHKDKLYVSVGSSCNACLETDDMRATVLEMDPDGRNIRIYATGLRNAVGLKWVLGDLFATDMGSDQFGTEAPEDRLLVVQDAGFYGWPYFLQKGNTVYRDTAFDHLAANRPVPPDPAYAALGAHTAALGFDYFQHFSDEALRGRFLVALHGSGAVRLGKGYEIVRVRKGEKAEPVITGFLQGEERYGRPCDVHMRDDRSFFFTDDLGGVVYLVRRKG